MPTENETKTNTNQTTQKVGEAAQAAQNVAQKTYGDFLGAYKSFSETTNNAVRQAASVLEVEIAQGVKIARQTENRFPQMDKFRSEKPDEVMQRFRRDAHEVIDIFIDVVGATLQSLPNMADPNVLRTESVSVKSVQVTQAQHPVITASAPVKAGGVAEIQVSFENNRNVESEEVTLYSTDLISNIGERLSSKQVKFVPAVFKIAPNQTLLATVTVAIPEKTVPGTYSGLVLASNMSELRSEIIVKVE
jgi:hypothetical protein